MLTFLVVAIAIMVGANVLAFGGLIAVDKFQDYKDFKAQAKRNAEIIHAYRVRYGAEGIEF